MTSPRPAPADAFAPGGRLYTVAEANRALPYVRRVVEDLVRDHARWRRCLAALDADRRGVPRPDDPDAGALGAPDADPLPADPAALRRLAARLSADVHAWLGELAALGVECKGMDVGLVDFPALVDGEPAYLCWQRGEPEVAWWHRPNAGYAGRRPIAALEPPGVRAPAGAGPHAAAVPAAGARP
jgi:hypothetical protein